MIYACDPTNHGRRGGMCAGVAESATLAHIGGLCARVAESATLAHIGEEGGREGVVGGLPPPEIGGITRDVRRFFSRTPRYICLTFSHFSQAYPVCFCSNQLKLSLMFPYRVECLCGKKVFEDVCSTSALRIVPNKNKTNIADVYMYTYSTKCKH